jgi:hypothetical protein
MSPRYEGKPTGPTGCARGRGHNGPGGPFVEGCARTQLPPVTSTQSQRAAGRAARLQEHRRTTTAWLPPVKATGITSASHSTARTPRCDTVADKLTPPTVRLQVVGEPAAPALGVVARPKIQPVDRPKRYPGEGRSGASGAGGGGSSSRSSSARRM